MRDAKKPNQFVIIQHTNAVVVKYYNKKIIAELIQEEEKTFCRINIINLIGRNTDYFKARKAHVNQAVMTKDTLEAINIATTEFLKKFSHKLTA